MNGIYNLLIFSQDLHIYLFCHENFIYVSCFPFPCVNQKRKT
jgi:hypothetical protein